MTTARESLINFYNPPSKIPVLLGTSHYTADPQLFPLPAHNLHCPHCRSQNESLISQFPHRNPAIDRPTASLHATSPDYTVTRTKTSVVRES